MIVLRLAQKRKTSIDHNDFLKEPLCIEKLLGVGIKMDGARQTILLLKVFKKRGFIRMWATQPASTWVL
jgi:hypothetical protein